MQWFQQNRFYKGYHLLLKDQVCNEVDKYLSIEWLSTKLFSCEKKRVLKSDSSLKNDRTPFVIIYVTKYWLSKSELLYKVQSKPTALLLEGWLNPNDFPGLFGSPFIPSGPSIPPYGWISFCLFDLFSSSSREPLLKAPLFPILFVFNHYK